MADNERDPYAEGYEAHDCNLDESANPYDLQTDEEAHLEWNDGWNAAAERDAEDGAA